MSRIKSSGPQPSDLLIVGEAPGKDELVLGEPFVGASGKELRMMLTQAGFEAGIEDLGQGMVKLKTRLQAFRMTNVFMNSEAKDLDAITGPRSAVPKSYALPPLQPGKYVLEEWLPEVDALREEILVSRPRLILALGNTATWALLQRTGIGKLRGNLFDCALVPGIAVIPTFHPSAILRNWADRPIAVGDIIKAKRWLDEGFAPPRRELWLAPTIAECKMFLDEFIFGPVRPRELSVDIETFAETITCIGFAPDATRALTIPFYDPAQPDRNFWRTAEEEREAWQMVFKVMESDIPKLGQNFLYDIQYLHRYGIRPRAVLHDTMIKHHSLHPELEKGLGFMGTLYTDEAPWKLLRDRKKDDALKIGDE